MAFRRQRRAGEHARLGRWF